MKYFVISALFLISSCDATNLTESCHVFNETLKSLEIYCENYVAEVPQNCTNNSKSVEPEYGLDLKIGGCNVYFLRNLMKHFNSSQTLNISYSGYDLEDLLILDYEFKQLNISPFLVKFDASHNEFEGIPWNFLNDTPGLMEIDLSYNMLAAIDGQSFGILVNLTFINLAHNFLILIDEEAFVDSPNLQCIDLSYNRFAVIPQFIGNEHLQRIHLEENPLYDFDCYHILWGKPIWIDISWGAVTTFNGDGEPGCKGHKLWLVQNNTFEGISAEKYQIHCDDQSFRDLNIFRAGRQSFDNVVDVVRCFGSQIWRVDFEGNHVGTLQSTTFENVSTLKFLSLRDTGIMHFDFDAIRNQTSLLGLDISHNNMKSVTNAELLQNFSLLFDFKAAENQIENITEVIKNLKEPLQTLDLSRNPIKSLDPNIFDHLITLQILNLSETQLTTFNNNPFEQLRNLKTLDISQNNFENVDFKELSATLQGLESFHAVNCDIQNVSNVIKYLGPFLEELDLSGNVAGTLNAQLFERTTNLKYLTLSHTKLTNIDFTSLQQPLNLEMLDLSHNELQEFDFHFLSSKLVWLNLEGNQLTTANNLTQSNFPKLTTLGIAQNAFSCTDLKRIVGDFSELEFIGNRWDQKHGDCSIEILIRGFYPFFIAKSNSSFTGIFT